MRCLMLSSILVGAGCAGGAAAPVDCEAPSAVCTIAGVVGEAGYSGDGAEAVSARLYGPMDVVTSPSDDVLVVVDWNNHKIREVRGGVIRTLIGTPQAIEGDGVPDPTGTPGSELGMNHPSQAEFGPDGALYVANWHNHRVNRYELDTGLVFPVAGTDEGFAGDGGPATEARLAYPSSVGAGTDGALFVIDQGNLRVRRIQPDGQIGTVAGNGQLGSGGDGGAPESAQFGFAEQIGMQNVPGGAVEVGPDGSLWIADSFNGCVRRIDRAADEVTTLDEGLSEPRDLEWGPDGRLYVLDTGHHQVRAYDVETGGFEVVVGTGRSGRSEDGTPALEWDLAVSHGIDIGPDGAIYIAETYNHRVLRVAPPWP